MWYGLAISLASQREGRGYFTRSFDFYLPSLGLGGGGGQHPVGKTHLPWSALLADTHYIVLRTHRSKFAHKRYDPCSMFHQLRHRSQVGPKRKVERQVKVLIKNLAIFFLFPSKKFLPRSFGSSACCVTSLHHDPWPIPPPPAPTPCVLTEPVFWQKSPAGTGKQEAKTWCGLEK